MPISVCRTRLTAFCIMIICIGAACIVLADGSVATLGRMGAGAPGGWQTSLEQCSWTHELTPGPLGMGAARIHFDQGGSLILASPAQTLETGKPYAVALWIRSEPAGAGVSLSVRDNENNNPLTLQTEATADNTWQLLRNHAILPPSVTGYYYLELKAHAQNCTLFLDGLWLGQVEEPPTPEWRPSVSPAGVVLEPVAPWGVVAGNAPHRVKAKVCGEIPSGAHLALHIVNTLGESSDLPAITVESKGFRQKEIDITNTTAASFGMLRVEAHIEDREGHALSPVCETLLARAPEPLPGPLPESYFGIHVLLREPDLEAVARLGYKWCRIHDASAITKWGYVEPQPGEWIWHDQTVDLAGKHGLSILGMFDTAPAWETGVREGGYFQVCHAPRDLNHWRNYVRKMTEHYAGRIDEWEVWNEPWDMMRFFQDGTPDQYVELMRAAYEEAKSVNPDAVIVGVNTYPPFWEDLVLALGGYSWYDKLSWHRYDPAWLGRPDDGIARVARRLNTAQTLLGGPPKPLLCSEGGPDVGRYHGSFFSFADPDLHGSWDEGADRYARFFLSAIAAGNERCIAYSVHNAVRHGHLTHQMIEPQFLLKPMHLASAALAHFIDGAPYDARLIPAPGISAHVFIHQEPRPFSPGPCLVAVLVSDGIEAIPLPSPLPDGVRCYDRWGNLMPQPPLEASRALIYLVAEGDVMNALREALSGPPKQHPVPASQDDLLHATVQALVSGAPPLWSLCSIQGSAAYMESAKGIHASTRAELKNNADKPPLFSLPPNTTIQSHAFNPAGLFSIGHAVLQADEQVWRMFITAVRDAPDAEWKIASLTLFVAAHDNSVSLETEALDSLRVWDACMREGRTDPLYATVYKGPCSMAASTLNGEYMLFTRADYLVTMLKTVLMWGAAAHASPVLEVMAHGREMVAVTGYWNITSLAFGMGKYNIAATFLRTPDGWKIASLCVGPDHEL